jgi:hypothetical protein
MGPASYKTVLARRKLACKPACAALMLYERAEPDGFRAEFSALKHHASRLIVIC